MWLSPPPHSPPPAPNPPQRSWIETQEVFSAARPSAPASYQSSGNLAASACKYLRMARWPRAPLAAHHRIRHPKGGKKISIWSRRLDLGSVHVHTHVSLISCFSTQTHLAGRIVYYVQDEFGSILCPYLRIKGQKSPEVCCELRPQLICAEAQLGPPFCQLWLLFGYFVQRLQFDKISGRKQRLVLNCVFVLNVERCHLASMDAVCAVAGPSLDVPLEVVAGERTAWTSFLKVLPSSPGQWETKDRMRPVRHLISAN